MSGTSRFFWCGVPSLSTCGRSWWRSIFAAAGVLLGLFFAPEFAQAANRTWGNTGTNFNTGTSWSGGTAPGSSDVAVFNVAMVTQPNLSGSLTIQELNFSVAASSGYDLTSS